MIVLLILLLPDLLGYFPFWVAELSRNRSKQMLPATDADEDIDALPFGPAPHEQV